MVSDGLERPVVSRFPARSNALSPTSALARYNWKIGSVHLLIRALDPLHPGIHSLPVSPHHPHGVRVTARLYGSLVFQTVRWRESGRVPIGSDGPEAIPTPSRGALVELHWDSPSRVRVDAVDNTASAAVLSPESPHWSWTGDNGVTVDLDLLARKDARRLPQHAGMDLGLAVVVMALLVLVIQVQLFATLVSQTSINLQSTPDPTPEYIARLLENDLDGADEGRNERAERREFDTQNQSFYLPSGNDGPTIRAGGGAQIGEEPIRSDAEPTADTAVPPPPDASPAPELRLDGEPDSLELPDAPGDAPKFVAELEAPEVELEDTLYDVPPEVEKFIGWGFKDWFDVQDARPEQKAEWQEALELARVRLRIDPNDPYALNTVGLYAYLAENHELSRTTYHRMMELYPDTPAAYNNYALVLKRKGQYAEEEALYRRALDLDPTDTHVLNNLAVCLAHQDRFDEALEVMDRLDRIDPDDSYADLHRAIIYAEMGKKRKALGYLEQALEQAPGLDTLHHIEFRQDLRLDPAFQKLRGDRRFEKIIRDAYGREADYLLSSGRRKPSEGPRG